MRWLSGLPYGVLTFQENNLRFCWFRSAKLVQPFGLCPSTSVTTVCLPITVRVFVPSFLCPYFFQTVLVCSGARVVFNAAEAHISSQSASAARIVLYDLSRVMSIPRPPMNKRTSEQCAGNYTVRQAPAHKHTWIMRFWYQPEREDWSQIHRMISTQSVQIYCGHVLRIALPPNICCCCWITRCVDQDSGLTTRKQLFMLSSHRSACSGQIKNPHQAHEFVHWPSSWQALLMPLFPVKLSAYLGSFDCIRLYAFARVWVARGIKSCASIRVHY